MHLWAALATGLVAGVVTAFGTAPVLRRLPEPREDDGSLVTDKIAYAALPTRTFVGLVAGLSGLLVAAAAASGPSAAVPLWFVLGTIGLLLAAIDARTTWLPLLLTRAAWASAAAAAVVAATLAATAPGNTGEAVADLVLRVLAGATVAGVLFGVVWRLTRGGIAFGDVRFAPLIGAAAGAVSWATVWWALLLGAVAGGLYGALRWAGGRRDPFPYAPPLLAGGWLALALTRLW